MNQSKILARLQVLFDDIFVESVVVTPDLSANDVEEWDSLLQISLIIAVEKAFRIRFKVGEVEKTRNVGDFAMLIAKRLAEK